MLQVNQFCGFMVNQAPGSPLALSSLSFVTSAVVNNAISASDSITAPTGIQAGDLIVFWDLRFETGTANAPSGFTIAVSSSVTGMRSAISYKIAAGTESGTTITGMTGASQSYQVILAVFRGNIPIGSVAVGSTHQEETANAPANQVCAASGGTAPLAVIATYSNAPPTAIATRGFSPAEDGEIATGSTHGFLKYKLYNSSPADTTLTQTDNGTFNTLQSCYLACA